PFCAPVYCWSAHADTPPPNTVKAKAWSGDGNTSISATDTSLDVNVTNSVGVTGTFWQSIQPVSGTLTCNAGTGTFNTSIVTSLPAGSNTIGAVNINGTIPTSNASVGPTGSTVP